LIIYCLEGDFEHWKNWKISKWAPCPEKCLEWTLSKDFQDDNNKLTVTTNQLLFNQLTTITIRHVYIAPEPGNPVLRRCTILLSLTQSCFDPERDSTPNAAYNACCHWAQNVTQRHSHHVLSDDDEVLIFRDEWTSHHMTALQLPEPRTRDTSAKSPTLYLTASSRLDITLIGIYLSGTQICAKNNRNSECVKVICSALTQVTSGTYSRRKTT